MKADFDAISKVHFAVPKSTLDDYEGIYTFTKVCVRR